MAGCWPSPPRHPVDEDGSGRAGPTPPHSKCSSRSKPTPVDPRWRFRHAAVTAVLRFTCCRRHLRTQPRCHKARAGGVLMKRMPCCVQARWSQAKIVRFKEQPWGVQAPCPATGSDLKSVIHSRSLALGSGHPLGRTMRLHLPSWRAMPTLLRRIGDAARTIGRKVDG
jgi:hypothetical protein